MSESTETQQEEFVEEEVTDTVSGASHEQELDTYGENVQKRINQEVEARRRAEREAASFKEELAKARELAQRAANEVVNLRKRVDAGDEAILDSLVGRLQEELNSAKAAYEAAAQDGDAKKIAEATVKVATMAADLRRAEVAKAGFRPSVHNEPERPPAPARPAPPPLPEETKKWLAANSDWYGKDPIKTNIALAADAAVKSRGFDPTSPTYYKELDIAMKRAIEGMTPGDQPRDPRSPAQATAPMGRSSAPAGGGARKVTLSANEQAIARKFGLTNEQYAAEKAKLG